MKYTIIYDNKMTTNYPEHKGLIDDWGFACLIEAEGLSILFDTGQSGKILLNNMHILGISPDTIDIVFLSHSHFDHIGGLSAIIDSNPNVTVYAPNELRGIKRAKTHYAKGSSYEIAPNIYSTGMIGKKEHPHKGHSIKEQSLLVRTELGIYVFVGCAHSGILKITETAKQYGEPYALIGGTHGFNDFDKTPDYKVIIPLHCSEL